jgi:hypothetical protein
MILFFILSFCKGAEIKENQKPYYDSQIIDHYDHYIEPIDVHLIAITESRVNPVTASIEYKNNKDYNRNQSQLKIDPISIEINQTDDTPSWLFVTIITLTIIFCAIFFGFLSYICFKRHRQANNKDKININNKINIKVENKDKEKKAEKILPKEKEQEEIEIGLVCSVCKCVACNPHNTRSSQRLKIRQQFYNELNPDNKLTDLTDKNVIKKLQAVCSRCKITDCKNHKRRAAERKRVKGLYYNARKLEEALKEPLADGVQNMYIIQNVNHDILTQDFMVDDGSGPKPVEFHSIPIRIKLQDPNPDDYIGQNGTYVPQKAP